MTQLETNIQAQRMMLLKRYASNDNRALKDILGSCLKQRGGKFLLQCNFDLLKLEISVLAFFLAMC